MDISGPWGEHLTNGTANAYSQLKPLQRPLSPSVCVCVRVKMCFNTILFFNSDQKHFIVHHSHVELIIKTRFSKDSIKQLDPVDELVEINPDLDLQSVYRRNAASWSLSPRSNKCNRSAMKGIQR